MTLVELILGNRPLLPRPAAIRPFELAEPIVASDGTEAGLILAAERGKSVIMAGVSILGPRMHVVRVISLFKLEDQVLAGWVLFIGHPDKPELTWERLDSERIELAESPFPNYYSYLVGEIVDPTVTSHLVPLERLTEIAAFVLPAISDDGPPEGFDW